MGKINALPELTGLITRLEGSESLETALDALVEAALELLPADHVSVRLLDDHGQELVSSARAGVGCDKPPITLRSGHGLAGWVCETGRAVRVDDALADERFVRDDNGFEIRALAAVPIATRGRVVGVLTATHAEAGVLSEEHRALLALVGAAATPVIDRLRSWRLDGLPQLSHALSSPLRLRLTAELLEVGELGLSLDDAVVRSGRHRQDVEACLRPMLRLGIADFDGARYRLRPSMPGEMRELIEQQVADAAIPLRRERHVRNHLLGGMIGLDPKMQMVFEMVQNVSRVDVPVLITGETGTGKELVARAIHDIGPRADGFFGAVNCATLKESLFESQMFGHARGAFTGAVNDYVGLVERCHQGTLFLDEVGDLSLTNQVKLLRFLQEGIFTRLGDNKQRRSDFRLVAATNRDLSTMVKVGQFREDLYYRLAVFPIRLPSLRERIGDLRYLVEGLLAVQARRFRTSEEPVITDEALRQLEQYHWPGNVRELENVLARAVVMAGSSPIAPEHIAEVALLSDVPPESDSGLPPDDTGEYLALRTLDDVQREHIGAVLRAQKGNIKATAAVLGISRTTLYKKIRDYDIDAPV